MDAMKIGWCPCGMPFYKDDTRVITEVDSDAFEVHLGIRCQHCGHEGALLMNLYCMEPGWNAVITL